ncbi:putative Transcription initiation factor IIB [Hypsibius exemplaris]|uniref:General transcription factor TFIIB n=1 Tax=Hypsibius exemplaris TaxID=2072580 RepID=A0A1W0X9Y4_HYPEX|nr:putative Transcription initiation factor IIB [Hypsibius exemplaris]
MSGFPPRPDKLGSVFCQYHPDAKLITCHESGDLVCSRCGLVIGDRLIDAGAEWRNYEGDADKSRCGKAEDPLMDANDLSTIIGPTPGGSKEFTKYAKYSGISSKERALRAALADIKDLADRLHLSETIVETAHGMYKDVTDLVEFRGGHKDALAVACLYISSNQEGVPRALDEVCKASSCNKKQVARCYKDIFRLLKLRHVTEGREKEFVERFGSTLELSRDVIKVAGDIAEAAVTRDIFPDRGPDVVVGAALLLAAGASGVPLRLSHLAQVCGASRSGLGTAYKQLVKHATTVYPSWYVPAVDVEGLPKVEDF